MSLLEQRHARIGKCPIQLLVATSAAAWPSSSAAWMHALEPRGVSNDILPTSRARWSTTVASPWRILSKALSTTSSLWRYSFLLVPFAPFTSFLLKRVVQGQSSRQTEQYHHKYETEPLVALDDYPCHLKIQASPLILFSNHALKTGVSLIFLHYPAEGNTKQKLLDRQNEASPLPCRATLSCTT